MSRGLGVVQRGLIGAFHVEPERLFTVEELVEIAFRGEPIERKHWVSVAGHRDDDRQGRRTTEPPLAPRVSRFLSSSYTRQAPRRSDHLSLRGQEPQSVSLWRFATLFRRFP